MRVWLLSLVFAAGGIAACEDGDPTIGNSGSGAGSGATTTSSGGGAPPDCSDLASSFLEETCRSCAIETCCEELAACDASPGCVAVFSCVRSCGADAACQSACGAGSAEAGSAIQCMSGCDAAGACRPPSTICDTTVSGGDPDCDSCLGTACCDETKACLADAVCGPCLETGDAEGCAGDVLFDTAITCFSDNCSAVCEG